MSRSPGTLAVTLLNQTATQKALGQDTSTSIHEFKVFNITITSLALCILTVTGVLCSVSLLRRMRQSKQARVYESAMGASEAPPLPATYTAEATTEPSSSLAQLLRRGGRCSLRRPLSLLRGRETPKDNSRIYYIYTNPLPVGQDEEEDEEEEERRRAATVVEVKERDGGVEGRGGGPEEPFSLHELAQDPTSGVTLTSETFSMLL